MNTSERTEPGAGVACRLTIGGQVIEFTLAGPLVAMAPAGEKLAKKTSKRGSK